MEKARRTSAPPKQTAGDIIHAIVKAGLSAVPGVGGSAAELFALIIAPPLEKRRDEWFQEYASVVEKLLERQPGIQPNELAQNDEFVSATFQATQIAMRTHRAEKRECLKNALFHVAIAKPKDDEIQFFLALVDAFTVTHIEILCLFRDRASFPQEQFRNLDANRTLTDPIVLDLNARGLLNDPRPFAARMREPMHSFVADAWTLSNLGSRFVAFISE